jgi:hypothetical protein
VAIELDHEAEGFSELVDLPGRLAVAHVMRLGELPVA